MKRRGDRRKGRANKKRRGGEKKERGSPFLSYEVEEGGIGGLRGYVMA